MAPKPRGSSSKRPRSALAAEKKGKKRQEPWEDSSDSSPPAHHIPRMFTATKTVTTGRKVDLSFFDQENFLIGVWIRQQGWEFACTLDVPIYPNLVRECFDKLKVEAGGVFKTEVKGKHITLSEQLMSDLLHAPREGIHNPNVCNRIDALKAVLEKDEVSDIELVMANQLSVELRILHSIICHVIFPKTGRHDWVAKREQAVMFFMMTGTQINLPAMMMQQIKDAAGKSKACLPYGMVFTLIFRHFKVNLAGEDFKKLMRTDYYNEKTLQRMKFHKVEERWVRMESGQEHAQRTEERREDGQPAEEEGWEAPEPMIPPSMPCSPQGVHPSMPSSEGYFTPIAAHPSAFPQAQNVEEILGKFVDEMKEIVNGAKTEVMKNIEEVRESTTSQLQTIRSDILRQTLRIESLETVIDTCIRRPAETIKVDLKPMQEFIKCKLEEETKAVEGMFKAMTDQISTIASNLSTFESRQLRQSTSVEIELLAKHVKEGIANHKEGATYLLGAAQRLDRKIDNLLVNSGEVVPPSDCIKIEEIEPNPEYQPSTGPSARKRGKKPAKASRSSRRRHPIDTSDSDDDESSEDLY